MEMPSAAGEERGDMTDEKANFSRSGPLWPEITELFYGPEDWAWAADRDRLAHDVRDPWSRSVSNPNAFGDK